jgi:excisionase family DNA binding protein
MSFAAPFSQPHEWISLPEAARRLGVHRTAVNTMILDGRLEGVREGPYWRVRLDQFEEFAATYTRPPNVPVPRRDPNALPPVAERALSWLARWGSATTAELRDVMTDAPGNIRKATDILRSRGLACRAVDGTWTLTEDGASDALRRGLVGIDV